MYDNIDKDDDVLFNVKPLKRSTIKASSINRGEGKIKMFFDKDDDKMGIEEIYVLCVNYNRGDHRKFVADDKDSAMEQERVLLDGKEMLKIKDVQVKIFREIVGSLDVEEFYKEDEGKDNDDSK